MASQFKSLAGGAQIPTQQRVPARTARVRQTTFVPDGNLSASLGFRPRGCMHDQPRPHSLALWRCRAQPAPFRILVNLLAEVIGPMAERWRADDAPSLVFDASKLSAR